MPGRSSSVRYALTYSTTRPLGQVASIHGVGKEIPVGKMCIQRVPVDDNLPELDAAIGVVADSHPGPTGGRLNDGDRDRNRNPNANRGYPRR